MAEKYSGTITIHSASELAKKASKKKKQTKKES